MKKWLLLFFIGCQTYSNEPLYILAQKIDSLEKRWALHYPIDTLEIDTLIQKIYRNYYQDSLYAQHLLQRCLLLKQQARIKVFEKGSERLRSPTKN